MDRSEKRVLVISTCLMLVFLSAVVYSVFGLGMDLPTCITDVEPYTEGHVIQRAPLRYEVQYVAKMWAFDPPLLEIPAGSTVDLYLTSIDVVHGFQIVGTNTNLMAVPGAVNGTQVTFDRPGEYRVICHEYCGVAHQTMYATIKVGV
ncbi:MAG: cytochrome C oxidase subunit II [Candidatus Krumholzibacteria bacterium]|nr:cytochrome C oxidase subunit II [Candidatus Krumholzibacteria bacterium]MDH4338522.1 cytochrome C oxidase subunit II [Candidatus Krumholzibacteria bacterium]MDH5269898.1 cytochrome C oxidase subunit II [Candidatus Krumholzibacteria bacterium]MDH5627985.1 cytochrome C oxidase subunit II [Candidatus Krumholzibacteria bacterium]